MRQMTRWMWFIAAPALIAGCAMANEPTTGQASGELLFLSPGMRVSFEGVLDFGSVVFAENPTTLLEAGDIHRYEFQGRAGGVVTVTMTAASCGAPDTLLDLSVLDTQTEFPPRAESDDAGLGPCPLDAQIKSFQLPETGKYLILATSKKQLGGGHYRLTLTCENNACAMPGAPTFASTRIAQTDIDNGVFSPDDLFEMGDFLFETNYQVGDGMGNALTGLPANNQPRPNFRPFPNNVHFAAFGAPEAQSCVSCHNLGGDDGAGDLNHNIFQIGDGINRASGVPRNPPPLLGSGLRQQIGIEMTAELQGQLAAGKAQAAATGVNVTVALSSKTRGFGSVVARPDGTVDFTNLNKGIDSDLVVKPFGWKGREATIRRFIEGGFRVHFGMQTEPSVNKHCLTPNVNTFGNGPNCQDPDGDGVTKEISDGQLSAEAVYMSLLQTPVRVPAPTAELQTRVNQGEVLFNQVGCQGCHTQNMTINNPIHVEPGDTTGAAGITLNLATDTRAPHPALNANGTMTVEIWSDFKRHDMGAVDCDSKNFNQIGACFFMTPPLWGIRNTAPYLHDGRAATLLDSVLLHGGGDDLNSVNAFKALSADDQSKIVEFMGSLGRHENLVANANQVDLTFFQFKQTTSNERPHIPLSTLVPHGGYLVVARNATKAEFEAFYGRTLGANVVYLDAATDGFTKFPSITGGATYTLLDVQDVLIDGPSIALPSGTILSRTSCDAPASAAASWTSKPASAANATPGTGPLSTGLDRICITEIADSKQQQFEYVEIFAE
jgi:mono/diheme cytochrome c family protein